MERLIISARHTGFEPASSISLVEEVQHDRKTVEQASEANQFIRHPIDLT